VDSHSSRAITCPPPLAVCRQARRAPQGGRAKEKKDPPVSGCRGVCGTGGVKTSKTCTQWDKRSFWHRPRRRGRAETRERPALPARRAEVAAAVASNRAVARVARPARTRRAEAAAVAAATAAGGGPAAGADRQPGAGRRCPLARGQWRRPSPTSAFGGLEATARNGPAAVGFPQGARRRAPPRRQLAPRVVPSSGLPAPPGGGACVATPVRGSGPGWHLRRSSWTSSVLLTWRPSVYLSAINSARRYKQNECAVPWSRRRRPCCASRNEHKDPSHATTPPGWLSQLRCIADLQNLAVAVWFNHHAAYVDQWNRQTGDKILTNLAHIALRPGNAYRHLRKSREISRSFEKHYIWSHNVSRRRLGPKSLKKISKYLDSGPDALQPFSRRTPLACEKANN